MDTYSRKPGPRIRGPTITSLGSALFCAARARIHHPSGRMVSAILCMTRRKIKRVPPTPGHPLQAALDGVQDPSLDGLIRGGDRLSLDHPEDALLLVELPLHRDRCP